MRANGKWAAGLVLVASLLVGGCGDDGEASAPTIDGATERDDATELSGEITVFAAASLTDAFTELGRLLEADHPGIDVTFNFGPSSGLVTQVMEGAPADVFASADETTMAQAVDAGEVGGDPVTFATNRMAIAVPAGNPGEVDGLDDFGDAGKLIGLCAEEVPCGRFGREVLDNAGIEPSIDTDEADVRSLLTKIESGDLDAGLVYRTDVQAAGDRVEGIEIAEADNVEVRYPVVALERSAEAEVVAAFVDLVTSDQGGEVLEGFGFLAP